MANTSPGDTLPGAPDPRGVTAVDGTAKARIERAALVLFSQNGVDAVSTREIAAAAQVAAVTAMGGAAREASTMRPADLAAATDFSGALWWGDAETARAFDQALANRPGPILPLITALPDTGHLFHERHTCVDTTASGGNAALLGGLA